MAYLQKSPIPVANGGTGSTTLGSNGVLVGNGTSPITAIITGTNGQVLIGATSATPSWVTATAGSGLTFAASSSSFQYSLTSPVVVSNGGTGVTSFATAFAPICGGSTSTGNLLQASTGLSNSGWILTSNGSGAIPTWQANTGGSGVGSLFGDNITPVTTASSVKFTGSTNGGVFTSSTTALTLSFNFISMPTTTSANGQIIIGGTSALNLYGTQNTWVGGAGNFTQTGSANIGIGLDVLSSLTSGRNNIAMGLNAGNSLGTGVQNTLIGSQAGNLLTSQTDNTYVGHGVCVKATGGSFNVGMGSLTLGNAIFTGSNNVAIGYEAGYNATNMQDCVLVGYEAGFDSTTGFANNTFVGAFAGGNATTTIGSVAIGYSAAFTSTSAVSNVSVGYESHYFMTTGSGNCALGYSAGSQIGSGSSNIHINNTGGSGDANVIKIGNGTGTGFQQVNSCFISGIQTISVSGTAVLVSTGDQLGVAVSSRRYKDKIEDMQEFSSDILRLRPVTYVAKDNDSGRIIGGLIAEEVAEVMPSIVVNDKEGQPQTVMYHEMPALLLNELQKALIRIEELERKVYYLEENQ